MSMSTLDSHTTELLAPVVAASDAAAPDLAAPELAPQDLAAPNSRTIDSCYVSIRELIMDAELLPNSHYMESRIADRIDADESLVHEAAIRLQTDGFISTEPRAGFWINPLPPTHVLDTFQQASALEARAAFVAALHSPSSVGMAALDDSILRMENALFKEDVARWAHANHHFHRSLVQCSGHSGLIEAALPLSEPLHRARMLALRLGPLPTEATHNHARVVEAIRRGLATDARDLHLDHWRSAGVQITRILEQNRMDSLTA